MKKIATIASVIFASATLVVASGCGGSTTQTLNSAPPNSTTAVNQTEPVKKPEAGVFMASLIKTSCLGQWDRIYDWLDPSQQAQISKSQFVNYKQSQNEDVSFDYVSAKPVDQYPTTLDGLKMMALTMKITVADPDSGKESTFTDTMHAIDRGNHWTFRMTDNQLKEALSQ